MSLNSGDQSVANAAPDATIHQPSGLGSCAPTNPQSSVGNAEEYGSVAQSWPDCDTTLGNRLHYLYNNEILSDVRFLVGKGAEQQRIPAHKLILSAGSTVFRAMFNGPLATTSLEVKVPDVEPAAFLAVLLFLYTDQFCGDPETVMMTLYAAKKYAVPRVEKHCVEFLRSNLSSSNAFMLLTQARFFNEPQLASVCLKEIDKSTAEALDTDGFRDIDIATLMLVLGRETLRINECKLFEAVVRWSEAECTRQQLPIIPENQRTVLGEAIYLVRFPVMSLEKFAAGPAQSGILTDREIVSLYLNFTYQKPETGTGFRLNRKPAVGFDVCPRFAMLGKKLSARRFQNSRCFKYPQYNSGGYSGFSQYPEILNSMVGRMSFTVDTRILLTGFGVYGCKTEVCGKVYEPTVVINLIHTSSGNVIASIYKQNLRSDGSATIYPVMFASPVEIEANTEYTAVANFQGPVSHYGFEDLERVTVDCHSTIDIVTFQFLCPSNTSPNNGYIPEIFFYI